MINTIFSEESPKFWREMFCCTVTTNNIGGKARFSNCTLQGVFEVGAVFVEDSDSKPAVFDDKQG